MDYEKYKNKLEYPSSPKKPYLVRLSNYPSSTEVKEYTVKTEEYSQALKVYETAMVEFRKLRNAYGEESARLDEEFKKDALEEAGITGNPKADKAYSLAWDRGHSCGYSEVFNELLDLAELLLD